MAGSILVDANILMDILTADPVWLGWSMGQLASARKSGPVIVIRGHLTILRHAPDTARCRGRR